jgi:hypothetical protein
MARVLPLPALRLFSPAEFNQLVSGGAEGGLDMDDLRGGFGGEGRGGTRCLRLRRELHLQNTREVFSHPPNPTPFTPLQTTAAHTNYSNGYAATSRTVKMFWEVVDEFTTAQRGALLKFVTSCGRAPLGGFRHLTPPFTIHKVESGSPRNPLAGFIGRDVDTLPSAR